jgi:DNA polymerase
MRNLFLDFETFFSDSYSLRYMTPIEYVLNVQFEALGCSFCYDEGTPIWVNGPDIPAHLATIDPNEVRLISHNASFDALIMSQKYSFIPKAYGCTLSMARNMLAHKLKSQSLASCAKYYGLDEKMDTLNRLKGVNYHALTQDVGLHMEAAAYCIDDVGKCRYLFHRFLSDGFPNSELDVVDWVVRMVARPQFEISPGMVAEHLAEVQNAKQLLLEKCGMDDRANLMKDEPLAFMLNALGINPVPTKISKTTGKQLYAFAKTDREFTNLLNHPDPQVQAIVAARIGHKSTLEETRTSRFLNIAMLTNRLPVPLKYSGAHTHRFSGDWKINAQNLPNGSNLRKALKAPKGKVVVSVDASQIEARLNAVLSGEQWLVDAIRSGEDVYSSFASAIYNRPIIKQLDKVERFVGKTAILSLGYGSSWPVFQAMCRNKGDVLLSDAMASQAVSLYRTRCPCIVEHWRFADRTAIPLLAAEGRPFQWGPLEVRKQTIVLPNGNKLNYPDLSHGYNEEHQKNEWSYLRGDQRHTLYGAKVVENECQSLAFVHIADIAVRVLKATDGLLWPAHQIHDELVYVVDEHLAEMVRDIVVKEMSTPPWWLPEAPLAAEGNIGPSYGELKN